MRFPLALMVKIARHIGQPQWWGDSLTRWLNTSCSLIKNWHLEDAITSRLEACATRVAQPSWLLVNGASSSVFQAQSEAAPKWWQTLYASLLQRPAPEHPCQLEPTALQELVVLSGKGGTGKTSVTASLAALAEAPVLADCDADAANLALVLAPQLRRREPFSGGLRARLQPELCTACGQCAELCRFDAIVESKPAGSSGPRTFDVDLSVCEGCGVCVRFCPAHAISLAPVTGGEWFLADTRFGPLIHARLQPGQGNSGKLTTLVREQARLAARATRRQLILIDGPPGVACPVMASLTGATRVLVVTEPTPAGEHDLERVLALTRHFKIPALVCVNKCDLNPALAGRIERRAAELGAACVGRIPYDPAVTAAQREGRPVVEYNHGPAAQALVQLWENVATALPPAGVDGNCQHPHISS